MYDSAHLPRFRRADAAHHQYLLLVGCMAVIVVFAALRGLFAANIELRVDEAYYWTWSKENVLSYLDHPPMIAWWVRFGTAIFGDTNFGVRFSGLVAILLLQLLLADIAWQTLRDLRYVAMAILLPDAALDYGMLMAKVAPDIPLIVFTMALAWSLVRFALSGNPGWWLLAGVFGGLALLSKYTAILLLPAIVAYVVIPPWRMKLLASPYPWLAALIAIAIFSPVLHWNAVHDWASFKFQLNRPAQVEGWSAKFLLDFTGQQFALVGPLLLPVVLTGTAMLAWRGFRTKDPISILFSSCVIFPIAFLVVRSLSARIGDSWPLFIWPFAFAGAVINLNQLRREAPASWIARSAPAIAAASIVLGHALVAATVIYYIAGNANYLAKNDPIGKEAGFGQLVEVADQDLKKAGASWFATSDYRIYSMLRWHLRDRVPVVQVNERSRYLDFSENEARFAGPVGLYVAPADSPQSSLWLATSAILTPVARADLTWRGYRYDSYVLQELRWWKPVFSPPAGDALYASAPQ